MLDKHMHCCCFVPTRPNTYVPQGQASVLVRASRALGGNLCDSIVAGADAGLPIPEARELGLPATDTRSRTRTRTHARTRAFARAREHKNTPGNTRVHKHKHSKTDGSRAH